MPKKLFLQYCINLATLNGGKCLSSEYIDNKKRNICLSNIIKLIIIPYTYLYINPDLMKDYIYEHLF